MENVTQLTVEVAEHQKGLRGFGCVKGPEEDCEGYLYYVGWVEEEKDYSDCWDNREYFYSCRGHMPEWVEQKSERFN